MVSNKCSNTATITDSLWPYSRHVAQACSRHFWVLALADSVVSIVCPFHGHGAPITPLHKIHQPWNTCQVLPPPHRHAPTIDDYPRRNRDTTPPPSTMRHGSKHVNTCALERHTDPHTTITPCTPLANDAPPQSRWWPCLITCEQFVTVGGLLLRIRR